MDINVLFLIALLMLPKDVNGNRLLKYEISIPKTSVQEGKAYDVSCSSSHSVANFYKNNDFVGKAKVEKVGGPCITNTIYKCDIIIRGRIKYFTLHVKKAEYSDKPVQWQCRHINYTPFNSPIINLTVIPAETATSQPTNRKSSSTRKRPTIRKTSSTTRRPISPKTSSTTRRPISPKTSSTTRRPIILTNPTPTNAPRTTTSDRTKTTNPDPAISGYKVSTKPKFVSGTINDGTHVNQNADKQSGKTKTIIIAICAVISVVAISIAVIVILYLNQQRKKEAKAAVRKRLTVAPFKIQATDNYTEIVSMSQPERCDQTDEDNVTEGGVRKPSNPDFDPDKVYGVVNKRVDVQEPGNAGIFSSSFDPSSMYGVVNKPSKIGSSSQNNQHENIYVNQQ